MSPEAHPDMPKLIELYKAQFGAEPDTSFVATGWDTIMMMAKAMTIAGTTDGAAVAKALEENEFDLRTGKLTYSNAELGHQPNKSVALIAVNAGKPSFSDGVVQKASLILNHSTTMCALYR